MTARLCRVMAAQTDAEAAAKRPRVRPRRAILVLAAVAAGGFAVLHLAGARATVGVLSGSPGSDAALAIGLLYAAAWFATVIAVPIALLALGLDAAWQALLRCLRRP